MTWWRRWWAKWLTSEDHEKVLLFVIDSLESVRIDPVTIFLRNCSVNSYTYNTVKTYCTNLWWIKHVFRLLRPKALSIRVWPACITWIVRAKQICFTDVVFRTWAVFYFCHIRHKKWKVKLGPLLFKSKWINLLKASLKHT